MSRFSNQRQWFGFIGWVAICFAASGAGALASIDAADFYLRLIRPDWAPPGSVFGPVWTLLFALMAVAAWLVWRRAGFHGARIALVLFLVQLLVNVLWSWLFFGWRFGAWALVDVLLLWGLIVATVVAFWRHHRVAGLLLVPYLLWVGFAAALNYRLWQFNPGLLG